MKMQGRECPLCDQPFEMQRCRICERETFVPHPRRARGLTLHADDDEVTELRREVERLTRLVNSLGHQQTAARLAQENVARPAPPRAFTAATQHRGGIGDLE